MKSFRVVFLDDDKKTFSISLPTVDDTKAINSTCELQRSGRNVRIATVELNDDMSETENYYNNLGYKFDKRTNW